MTDRARAHRAVRRGALRAGEKGAIFAAALSIRSLHTRQGGAGALEQDRACASEHGLAHQMDAGRRGRTQGWRLKKIGAFWQARRAIRARARSR